MSFEHSPLPPEAVTEMSKNMEGLEPAISESDLLKISESYPEIKPLIKSLLDYAERYAADVWSMNLFIGSGKFETEDGAREFAEMDDARTRLHSALVDSVGILSRKLVNEGVDNSWVRELTDGHTLSRSSCGAFALLLVYRRYIDNKENIL